MAAIWDFLEETEQGRVKDHGGCMAILSAVMKEVQPTISLCIDEIAAKAAAVSLQASLH